MNTRKSALVRAFFARLERSDWRWCVVGDTSALPDRVEHDIDLVFEPQALARVPRLMRDFADDQGVHLIQELQHEIDARFFVFAWIEDDTPRFLYLDVCADWRRGSRVLLRSREILADRVPALFDGGRYWTPAPAINFAYYLLKRLDKGVLDDEHGAALARDFARDPDACRAFLARRLPVNAAIIGGAASADSWDEVRRRLDHVRQEVRAGAGPAPRVAELARRALRLARPTGLALHLATRVDDAARRAARAFAEAWAPAFRRVTHIERAQAIGALDYLEEVRPLLVRSTLVTLTAPAVARTAPSLDLVGVADGRRHALVLDALTRRQAGRCELGWFGGGGR